MASFRYFVFSRGVFSLFRYFALRYFVISSFCVALFRYFVILRGVISWQKDEKTKWHISATIVPGHCLSFTFSAKLGVVTFPLNDFYMSINILFVNPKIIYLNQVTSVAFS